MKKIVTISSVLILTIALLAGCSRRGSNYNDGEDYWLSKESGIVVYSDDYCPYYVIETRSGYTVVESLNGYAPYEDHVIYGDLSRAGTMDLYDRSRGTIIRGDVVDYWLTYSEAQYMIDNLCYTGYKSSGTDSTAKKVIKKSAVAK
ncbi:MAG: hypothetical protein ABIR18_11095 [Chitinophagaceae bacterium]